MALGLLLILSVQRSAAIWPFAAGTPPHNTSEPPVGLINAVVVQQGAAAPILQTRPIPGHGKMIMLSSKVSKCRFPSFTMQT